MAACKQKGGGTKTPVNLSTEWLELESDPGLFTLLIQDFGVRGVKVEEVYDVTQSFEDRVFGFVFLFQWIEDRRARKKALLSDDCYVTEPSVLQNMFFAHQIVTNSCATHALLSILLNCTGREGGGEELDLGPTLSSLKDFCLNLDPEMRGYAIGNLPDLAAAHNRYARPDPTLPTPPPSKRGTFGTTSILQTETYHFVSYIPHGERLFELDGLKEWPIDHGPWAESEDWTDLFKRVITRRLNEGEGIQYNLMALIPDPLPRLSSELRTLQTREENLLDLIYDLARERVKRSGRIKSSPSSPQQLLLNGEMRKSEKTDSEEEEEEIKTLLQSLSTITIEEEQPPPTGIEAETNLDMRIRKALQDIRINKRSLDETKRKFEDELDTRKRYQVDAERRTHDYDEFFKEYFKALATHQLLPSNMMEPKRSSSGLGSKKSKKPGRKKKKAKTTLSNGP